MRKSIQSSILTDAQLMVLQIVNAQCDEQDLEELRHLLLEFNNEKMQKHLDKTVAEKNYQAEDFDNMLYGHSRKDAKDSSQF